MIYMLSYNKHPDFIHNKFLNLFTLKPPTLNNGIVFILNLLLFYANHSQNKKLDFVDNWEETRTFFIL